jgi:hypothetical protein
MLVNCNYLNEIKCHYLNPPLNEVECNVYPLSEVDILHNFQFGFSKIFRIKEPMVLSKILKEPSLFSQNNEQISCIKAYLNIFRFYEICDYRSKISFHILGNCGCIF